ncbi:MAG: sigma-54-dependent Fis family transcriptional regulator [Deltaproteobacteria bacterium]|nr:sigma-54-dependent Fis family transcriptional regulator [Deltaproteobacteria bacterium]MBW2362967.1 sigma-54-dependent Fis family transcriptional regulator [Deltaproteobacteria bacterium]
MAERLRVLVIDDDPGVREYMEALVSRQGYEVFAAVDGEEALAKVGDMRPDLITLDVVLPGIDGLATLAELKKKLPDVPVVMLSGHGQARNIVEAMRLGASDFLRKPFEVEELELAFQKALEKRALKQEVELLRSRARTESELLMLTGGNAKMREVTEVIEQVADTDITVLVRGESGTGKELVARTLFQLSNRREKPFVKVNCAALPSELLESELFGFEKGAFTGAQKRKLGKFEFANNGTIFLDEISEMHPSLQAKLLQVLQDGEFSRLGGEADVKVDTRIIAATNRDLEAAVRDASFREDLFYRLNVVTIVIPPLRDRRDSIPVLVDHFLQANSERYKKEVRPLSAETLGVFMQYHWPGNVRELENMIRRIVVLGTEQAVLDEIALRGKQEKREEAPTEMLGLEALGADFSDGEGIDLKAISRRAAQVAEKRVIEKVLGHTRWNRKEAAERLQISYKALLYKMKENGLSEGR